jgi:membrane associated rhomboid family serine protease
VLSLVLWTVVYVPAWMLLVLFFVTQFLTPGSDAVAWQAHVAGMLAGFLFALVLARFFPDPLAPQAAPVAKPSMTPWAGGG